MTSISSATASTCWILLHQTSYKIHLIESNILLQQPSKHLIRPITLQALFTLDALKIHDRLNDTVIAMIIAVAIYSNATLPLIQILMYSSTHFFSFSRTFYKTLLIYLITNCLFLSRCPILLTASSSSAKDTITNLIIIVLTIVLIINIVLILRVVKFQRRDLIHPYLTFSLY